MASYHSIRLIKNRCIGCTDCIKRCPTEAIRVRNGKAYIMDERCIDCGNCIRVCKSHAKVAMTDSIDTTNRFKIKIAVPAPSLFGQFVEVKNINHILTALKMQGFDDVFEVALAAELVSEYTKNYTNNIKSNQKPIISSACPAVVRMIIMRFPSLIDHILPVLSPMEVAAEAARKHYMKLGYKSDEIGVFFITPCAAKATYALDPIGITTSNVDGVISIRSLYLPMRNALKKLEETNEVEFLSTASGKGIHWALSGGESNFFDDHMVMAVDGIENVVDIMEALENGQIGDVAFIEGLACTGGCVGGPLTVVNGYLANNHMRKVILQTEKIPIKEKRDLDMQKEMLTFDFTTPLKAKHSLSLDDDLEIAMEKLEQIERIHDKLPQIDCGSCGAPTCYALAEDITFNRARKEDCVILFKEEFLELSNTMMKLIDHTKIKEEEK